MGTDILPKYRKTVKYRYRNVKQKKPIIPVPKSKNIGIPISVFVAGVQSVAEVYDYEMHGHLPCAPRRGAAPSQGDGGILVKRALEMLLFESVKLKFP